MQNAFQSSRLTAVKLCAAMTADVVTADINLDGLKKRLILLRYTPVE